MTEFGPPRELNRWVAHTTCLNLKKLSIDEYNYPILIVVFILIVLLDGALAATHWSEWIHWKWTEIVRYFFGITISVFFVSGLSYCFAELLLKNSLGSRIKRSRGAAYALCCVLVLTFAVVAGLVVAAPVYPGDEIESTGSVATEYRPPMPLHKRDALIEKNILGVALAYFVRRTSGAGAQASS